MSKLYAGFLVIASMLALSGLGMLGLVLITHLIDLRADMAWVGAVLESEFFWGIIVGLLLSIIGSYVLAFFATRQQRQERKEVLKSFCHHHEHSTDH